MNFRQVYGPKAGNLTLTASFQLIPDLIAKVTHGNGPILVEIRMDIQAQAGGDAHLEYGPCFDSDSIGTTFIHWLYVNERDTWFARYWFTPQPGAHVWKVTARDTLNHAPLALQNSCALFIMEFPRWDETPFNVS